MRWFVLLLLIAGCEERIRYYCQDPKHWEEQRCKRPDCEVKEDCPDMLIKPIKDERNH